MKRNIVLYYFILLTFVLTTTDLSAGLSLQQLWQITDQQNLSLRQQEQLIARAEEEIAIQQSAYYPSLSATANGAWLFFNEAPAIFQGQNKDIKLNTVALNVNQALFTGFRTKNATGQAKENFNIQSIQKEITRSRVFLEIGQVYYDIQANELQQQVLQESIQRIDNQLIKIRNLLEAKQVTPFDTLELANKKLQIFTQVTALHGQMNILYSQLRYLTNTTDLKEIETAQSTAANFSLDPLDNYFQIAWQKRPELRQIAAQKRSNSFTSGIIKGAFYPTLAVSGAYNNASLDGFVFDGNWIDFYSVFLSFQWDLWNWRRDARKVQQVKLETDRLELANQDLIAQIRQQVFIAYQILETTQQQIALQDQLVVQEEERFRQSRERYERGLTTILDLSSAENDLTTAQLELHKTKILWHKNKLQLDFATGIIGIKN